MLRHYFALLTAILFLSISVSGCSGSKDLAKTLPPTISTIEPAKGLTKRVGIVLIRSSKGSVKAGVGALYLKALIDAVHHEDDSLELVTALNGPLPPFLSVLASSPPAELDAVDLAMNGRRAGYQGVMTAAVQDIRVSAKKTGFFWFRKLRYFIALNITLDLYDPYTAAKIVGAVEEISIKISAPEYDAYVNDESADIEALNDAVVDVAEELAERVVETLDDMPWQSSVIDIRSDRLVLPAGLRAGLRPDDRLVVFEGRRTIDGRQGERFIVPGKRLAEVRIISIGEQVAEASGQDIGSVQVGDILVPVK